MSTDITNLKTEIQPSESCQVVLCPFNTLTCRWLSGKQSTCNAGDAGSILGLESSPGKGNGNKLQYFCLSNPMDRGVWQTAVYGIAGELDMTQPLNSKTKQLEIFTLCFQLLPLLLPYATQMSQSEFPLKEKTQEKVLSK